MRTVQLAVGGAMYAFAARAMEWEEQDLSELVESVKVHGVREPVLYAFVDAGYGNGTTEKVYLDGRRRLLAAHQARLADFDVVVEERRYEGDTSEAALSALIDELNSAAVVRSEGARKRTPGVLAMMGPFLAKHRPAARARQAEGGKSAGRGRPKAGADSLAPRGANLSGSAPPKKRAPKTSEAVAAETGVSARTVERVAAVEAKGTPEIAAEVRAGRIPPKVAEQIVKMPEEEQRVVATLVRDGVAPRNAARVAKLEEKPRAAVVRMVRGGMQVDRAIVAATSAAGPECDLAWVDFGDGSFAAVDAAKTSLIAAAGSLSSTALVVALCGACEFTAARSAVATALGMHGEVMRTPLVWLRSGARGSSWCALGDGHELIVVARVRGCGRRLESSAVFREPSADDVVAAIAAAWGATSPRKVA